MSCKDKPLGLKWTTDTIRCLGIWCGPNVEDAIQYNFKEKIKKMKTLLNIWSQRKLSLKGKVAVLRTIVLPQILYVASTLYTPKWVENEVNELFFNFLWSNKKTHVRKEVIINEIHRGGLKMPVFSGMIRGMKCSWIKRLLSKEYLRVNLASNFVKYKTYTIDEIIKFKLDLDHIVVISPFYEQILRHWYEIYCVAPVEAKEICNMSLWHNKFIKIDNKPIIFKHWYDAGIRNMSDVMSVAGKLLSLEELELKFGFVCKQMDYNCLTHAVPKKWLKIISGRNCYKIEDTINVRVKNKQKNVEKLTCKDVYWEYVRKIGMSPVSEQKWNTYLNIDDMSWEELYVIPYTICKKTIVQSFQYNLFNRIYPCQYTLSIWYKDEQPNCKECENIDYLEHHFYDCKKVKPFWDSIEKWWNSAIETTFPLNSRYVLFGLQNPNEDEIFDIMNLCILYAKWYISGCKRENTQLFLPDFIRMLRNKLMVEKTLCQIKGDDSFEKRWLNFYEKL